MQNTMVGGGGWLVDEQGKYIGLGEIIKKGWGISENIRQNGEETAKNYITYQTISIKYPELDCKNGAKMYLIKLAGE